MLFWFVHADDIMFSKLLRDDLGLLPPLRLPGHHGGLRPLVIKEENAMPPPCLGLLLRGHGLVPLLFLPAALPVTLLLHLLILLETWASGRLGLIPPPQGGLYDHPMLSQEKEGASARA
ncbi:UNVERIFIED_CONTAM: hypothetical protein Slati_1906400 [Sesamum latifolium]|uniref:Uncharacterized protein n=1 Tax=Sesamum latifolium TaxID=2727402 RepID=A0AAW2X2L7_9LAMI